MELEIGIHGSILNMLRRGKRIGYLKGMCSAILFVGLSIGSVYAQAFNVKVEIEIDPQLATRPNKDLIAEMEKNFAQFMNTTLWHQDKFEPQERIVCNFLINIREAPRPNSYKAYTRILAVRPVYGGSYESLLLDYTDQDFIFEYVSGQSLRYSQGFISDNLTALLSFYAYLILGLDYDSFGLLSGSPFFEQAQEIARLSNGDGWSRFGGNVRSRFWLVDNLLDQQLVALRNISYTYHREGMDIMISNPQKAREQILLQLEKIQTLLSVRSLTAIIPLWIDSKHRELIGVFSQGSRKTKQRAFGILSKIDPSRTENYRAIVTN